jgi:glycosyltransferase involved in cell wall biosynthesis
MSWPLVTVIIPCYNNADFIADAVNSVLQQDYPRIEVIVIDDGSTDSSVAVLQQFEDRIRLIRQANQGPAAARNTGLKAATGDYIAFNDADDIWLPGKLMAQVSYMQQHPHIGLCYTNFTVWRQQQPIEQFIAQLRPPSSPTEVDAGRSGWLYTQLLEKSLMSTIAVMLRRELVRTVGFFDTSLAIGEDYDYWIRVSRQYQMDKLSGVYAIYRTNPDSTTQKVHPHNYSLQVLQSALQKYGRRCPSGKEVPKSRINRYLGERHFSYGYNAMIKGHRDKALTSFKACIALRHRFVKASLLALLCAVPLLYRLRYRTNPHGE